MLVLISDLHLSDESTAHNINPEAFGLFQSDVTDMTQRRQPTELHVVLLGDVFDLVRTNYWLQSVPYGARPWNGQLDPQTAMNPDMAAVERQFAAVLEGVLATAAARQLTKTLLALSGLGLPFKVTYIIGNHDRVLHNFPSLRARIEREWPGISVTFADEITEDRYHLRARHGHVWDENTHGWEFRNKVLLPNDQVERLDPRTYVVMAIGEVVTAELMSGLVYHAVQKGPQNDRGFDDLINRLKDLNNLRPVLDVFSWLDWFGGETVRPFRQILHGALRAALDGVLGSSLAKRWDALKRDFLVSGDLVDRLEFIRKRVLGRDFTAFQNNVGTVTSIVSVVDGLTNDKDSLLEGARQEMERLSQSTLANVTQFIVYGHTHRARHDYFSGTPDGLVRMYINTGTFLPLIQRARDNKTFAASLQMTKVFLYGADEDTSNKLRGPSLDIWDGTRRKVYQ